MNLKSLENEGKIRRRSAGLPRVRSLLESVEANMNAVQKIHLDDSTSTIVFRETYESIRQLGEATWWRLGYAPKDHIVSLEVLKEEAIENSALLLKLDRFRQIRHTANYGGYMVPVAVAKEILEFWELCGKELLTNLKNESK